MKHMGVPQHILELNALAQGRAPLESGFSALNSQLPLLGKLLILLKTCSLTVSAQNPKGSSPHEDGCNHFN